MFLNVLQQVIWLCGISYADVSGVSTQSHHTNQTFNSNTISVLKKKKKKLYI